MTFTDDLRRAAEDPGAVPDLPGLLTAAAWHLDRVTAGLARATGRSEAAVAVAEGLTTMEDE